MGETLREALAEIDFLHVQTVKGTAYMRTFDDGSYILITDGSNCAPTEDSEVYLSDGYAPNGAAIEGQHFVYETPGDLLAELRFDFADVA